MMGNVFMRKTEDLFKFAEGLKEKIYFKKRIQIF